MQISLCSGGWFIDQISSWLEAWGYRYVEVPSLCDSNMFASALEGTENRMFSLEDGLTLIPEVTNYIRAVGPERLGANRVYYVARCFRDETTTDSERLREFTQIGVELLGDNPLDCRKVVRKDALRLFKKLLGDTGWQLDDAVQRGLNLYNFTDKTFEITSESTRKQLLGGGPYEGGAGWALGLERFIPLIH